MNPKIAELYRRADAGVDEALKRQGVTPPCCKGCFHCCREPVYASAEEVKGLLEIVMDEEGLRARVVSWLAKFLASKTGFEHEPKATTYRALNLWCPLLVNGECSVYDRRPLACRTHVAWESSAGCEHDELREHQKFAMFPGLIEALQVQRLQELDEAETDTFDHLGILLAELLLGMKEPTRSRLRFTVNKNSLIVEKYGE